MSKKKRRSPSTSTVSRGENGLQPASTSTTIGIVPQPVDGLSESEPTTLSSSVENMIDTPSTTEATTISDKVSSTADEPLTTTQPASTVISTTPLVDSTAKTQPVRRPTPPTATNGRTEKAPAKTVVTTPSSKSQSPAALRKERQAQTRPAPSSNQRRRRQVQKSWWRRNPLLVVGGTLILVGAIVGIFIFLANNQNGGLIGSTDPYVLKKVTSVPQKVFADVSTGNVQTQSLPQPTQGNQPILKGPTGKPQFFYYGAEYCPLCAAQRWAMVVALSHFGKFTALPQTKSSSTDTYPNTATFTFVGSQYTSSVIDFVPLEAEDRDQQQLQTPTPDQQQLLTKYKVNGFPFIDIADQYTINSPLFDPAVLTGMTQKEIADKLADSSSDVSKSIIGSANYITAAICLTIQDKADVCTQDPIPTIEQSLAHNAQGSTPGSSVVFDSPVALATRRRDGTLA